MDIEEIRVVDKHLFILEMMAAINIKKYNSLKFHHDCKTLCDFFIILRKS